MMDPPVSPSKDSVDVNLPEIVQAETVETENSVKSSIEDYPIDIKEEIENGEIPEKKEVADVSKAKTIVSTENGANEQEIPKGIETVAVKKEEETKKESPVAETKIVRVTNVGKTRVSPVTEIKEVKRKRRSTSDQQDETSVDEIESRPKRVKVKNTNDNYCWRCHKDSVDARCSACPRSWHRKCMGGQPPTSINETWICGECATILRAENAETRSEVVAHMSIDHLCMLLKYIVERMRSCPGSEPFWKAVDLTEVPNYMDYVIRPMDLNLLESNVRAKLYGSTDAFMADAKWIQHNCIVFNTCGGVYADTSKLTNAAKQIIKTAKQEVAEIEACPDCYARGRNLPRPHPMWFIEACRRPHPLIWAKLKGFPFWPAKAMPRVNGQGHVDVRFFGQHDRAWVAPKDVYLYSRDPPAPMPRKRKLEMAECIKEITRHCRKLEMSFGPFQFAPAKTSYNPNDPMQIKIMLPQYDPSRPSDSTPSVGGPTRRKSPLRKRSTLLKRKMDSSEVSTVEEPTVESSTKESSTSPQIVTPNEHEKSKDTTILETPVSEPQRPKKRMKKSLNSETKNTTQEKEPSSPIQVIETSSTSTVDDVSIIAGAMSNGSPETPSIATPLKTVNQSKAKSEKTDVPLEKSLAALLRTVNPKGRLSHPRNLNVKSAGGTPNTSKNESKVCTIKVYKPKARMLDKVNAEKAMKSSNEKEHDKLKEIDSPKSTEPKIINGILTPVPIATTPTPGNSGPGTTSGSVSLLHNKRDNNIIITNSLLKMSAKKLPPRILVLNNGTLEPKRTSPVVEEKRPRAAEPAAKRVQSEPQILGPGAQKKQSRAKKSFPNKAPRLPQLLPKMPKPPGNSLDAMVYIPAQRNENGIDYQLPPPEAGPLSSQLHRSANELVKHMAQLMEEAIKEAADSNSNDTGNNVESHQATIHSLRLQIERMRWQHQQQLAELKHNTDRTLREMRASLEAERLRAIEEVRKEAEEDKARCIEETKSKQWCAQCGRKALFYCCWNTAYCDHVCQQAHWQSHQRKCAQKPSNVSNSPGDSSSKQQQQLQQQKASGKSNSDVGTIEEVSRSGFLASNVVTKNLKVL
ncbi:protein kinase C-binding protein 1 isoform X2 [Venturia canescens]|uniref:protein kinase C-binding protein 1 isoform X2 n=1 Tax=Venturia canescens TaxID=32260 RepID=UPI001C9BEC68|nr:protein kinase C-binding protein 1 isoform X2 [Venturia canescens]